jgi:hypothetical protein
MLPGKEPLLKLVSAHRLVRTEVAGHYVYCATELAKRTEHQVTNIQHLALDGLELTCPKHKWAFDLTSGACVKKGTLPLKRFEAKVENGRLLAFW